MIDVLSKPADRIGVADIRALIDSEVPEGEQIEFKEALPAEKGKTDPWMDGKNSIGNYARDSILEEAVAFANAHGGALLLGIGESPDPTKSAIAANISPIPRCADLAERLKLAFRDCVEPQLPMLEVFSVATENDGGVIAIRVGRSRLAPHRVGTTRHCPVRRSDRCEKMTMREIQDMTLNLSRGLERLEQRLKDRANRFPSEFQRLATPDDAWGLRLTAAPVQDDLRIERVFQDGAIVRDFDAPWRRILHRENELKGLLEKRIPSFWRPKLRATRAEEASIHNGRLYHRNSFRELHCDGLIELGFAHARFYPRVRHEPEDPEIAPLPPGLPTDMFANLALWADHIRRQVNSPTVEYALEFEICVVGGTVPVSAYQRFYEPDLLYEPDLPALSPGSIIFPKYSLGDFASIPNLISVFYRDFWNHLGQDTSGAEGLFTIQE